MPKIIQIVLLPPGEDAYLLGLDDEGELHYGNWAGDGAPDESYIEWSPPIPQK